MEDSVGKCLSAYYCTGSASVAVEREREIITTCAKRAGLYTKMKKKREKWRGVVSPMHFFVCYVVALNVLDVTSDSGIGVYC